MSNNKNSFLALLPLYMVILVDIMGIVLVFPILTPLILQPSSGMVPVGVSEAFRDFLYGFALALYPFFMFFSTPILGDLSDKFGRKKILLLCMFVTAFSYLIATIGILAHNLTILLISRCIAGLASGTQPVASAAIIDLSPVAARTKNLSWIVFIASIGVIIGPLLGGLTSVMGFYVPFILSGALALVNAVFLMVAYRDNHVSKPDQAIHFTKGFRLFVAAFSEKKFALLAFASLGFSIAWSLYYQAVTWLFMEKFNYDASKIGLFVGFLGVLSALGTSVISKIVMQIFSDEKTVFMICVLLMAVANVASGLSHSELSQWLWVILNAIAEVLCYTLSMSLFSSSVSEDKQGWIMGVVGAIGAMTWTIGGLISGPLGYMSIDVPMFTAGALCFASFILMLFYRRLHRV